MLRVVYDSLLRSRDLVQPDGRPLHAYRFTRAEFEAAGNALKTAGACFVHDRRGCALFVAYTAEWFRRIREGGHWDWIHPLRSLNIHYRANDPTAQIQYSSLREATETGLRVWRRSPKRALAILQAVIAESGFPASAVRQGPRLANWLRRSVLAMEAGFAADEAVAAEAWRAPESLVQILFDAAVSLCRAITDLRASVPPGPEGEDAVQRLSRVRPDWPAELPFDLEEQDVRKLVEDLVRARHQDSRALDVVRRLRRTDSGWVAFAELSLKGTLDHRQLPGQLRVAVDKSSRVRLRPGGALAERGHVVAALERITDDQIDIWEVRPLVQGCDVALDLSEEFRLQAIANERVIAEFTAFAGDPCEGPVIALEPSEVSELHEAAEFLVLGASPVRTPLPWLLLGVDSTAIGQLRIEGERLDLGKLADGSRLLIAFSGTAEIEIGGERLVWRTGSEKREAPRLSLIGDLLRNVEGRVFQGCPSVWLIDDDAAFSVPQRDLVWRPIGSRDWTPVKDREPLGRVELAIRRRGALVAWARADIVPTNFRIQPNAKNRTLRLSGLAGAQVGAAGPKPLPSRRDADEAVINLMDLPRGGALHLQLRWANILEMALPDPVAEPILLGPGGGTGANIRLSVGRLSGYRLLTPYPWTLIFELRRFGVRPAYASRQVDGLVPLSAFGELVRQLLGGCEELDAFVRLSWAGRPELVAEIGWYDLDQSLVLPESSSPFAVLASATSPLLSAFSLAEPQAGIVHPSIAPANTMVSWLTEHLGVGPWLLSGVMQDGRRLRPQVLDASAGVPAPAGLLFALRQPTRQLRDAALDAYLSNNQPSVDELRCLVELALVASKTEIPYASVDALRALARTQRTAIFVLAECNSFAEREAVLRLQSELACLWCTSAIEDWIAAIGARRTRLATRLAEFGEDGALSDATIARGLMEILDLQPTLRVHVQVALLLNGISAAAQHEFAQRLGRRIVGGIDALAQDLIKRRGDGQPPSSLGLSNVVRDSAAVWTRYDSAFADVLAAPFVAGSIAMSKIEPEPYLAACRSAWLFDRDYFEAAVVEVLFERAHSRG
ncbi:STY4851/ECs_5259 family protein [Mesorhizobium abyssinicae]|uniref:STY4851/ECs_5259 family protein n=1 Tax=Mesorhizobium abyssinicae TaxID=1209958 RepID=A0ABU5AW39_9HYPH|nr:STY4851/ECs_5259 family protein [Mesorhizobium abyssinicae]MDX8541537.1 STY4851/ECs_5259 family protein [Mesorhizobium abyssinicae]